MDNQAELAVLSAMAQGGTPVVGAVAPLLESYDFVDEVNGFLFERLRQRWTDGQVIDRVTLTDDLLQVDIHATNLVESLFTNRVDVANVIEHANIVYRNSMLRQLSQAGQQVGQYTRESGDFKGILAAAYATLDSIAERESMRESGDMAQILANAQTEIETRATANRPLGFTSGIAHYDMLYGGLRRKHIHYVSAYTSVGKSWWAVKSGIGFMRDDANLCVVSLEMSAEQWALRFLASLTGIDSRRIEVGTFYDDDERYRYHESMEWLKSQKLKIFSNSRRMKDISRLIRFHRPDIVIIDYIQKMQGEAGDSRYETLTKAGNDITAAAVRNDCGVMVVSSVSNETAFGKEKSGEPRLKGSGDLAFDADGVIDLKRDKEASPTKLEVRFSKNRHGPTGWANYRFDMRCGSIEEISSGM